MTPAAKKIQTIYLSLLFGNTLAASLIWGINTLFLLDAGLSNAQAFAANAFFTAGMVLFEVPTGIIADTKGRRLSYLLGTSTLIAATLLYLLMWQITAPFWGWAISSVLLGLGFTFFSGAVEAWLVDALAASSFTGKLEAVFAKGQIVTGVALLGGSMAGGLLAQMTNLGIPYLVRAVILAFTFVGAFVVMRDIGFKPASSKHPLREMRHILHSSVQYGLRKPSIRWLMLTAPFMSGVGIYAFYAMQPYLLELYGDPHAYLVAGLAAAIIAGAQIAGGLLAPQIGKLFVYRTSILLTGITVSAGLLIAIGLWQNFWLVIFLCILWGLLFAAMSPPRQAYLNSLIPSKQRATVLSFDALLGSGGGVVLQPGLGKVADVWNYPASYIVSGLLQALAIPFALLARRFHAPSDRIHTIATTPEPPIAPTTN